MRAFEIVLPSVPAIHRHIVIEIHGIYMYTQCTRTNVHTIEVIIHGRIQAMCTTSIINK